MTSASFREHIRTSISNESLQAALDANAKRRVKGRIDAFASLPDWRARRQRAHAVRADVVEHLDEYLSQFIAKAQKNGIVIHRAENSEEAINIVLKITSDSLSATSPLVAKSKSMISEEIELNHALEANGIRVVETDLGEYIVQLRGEKPAHIITPAVHLRRHEVGQLFHEKLGIPYTEDIPTLVTVARKVLREVFLTADIGISGVNFGVSETGTLCIVTNEGNGRMVTTMPPVHIALMGMERLVPTPADLALMLSLLPRSATGQKLSVYTQLIQSPRRKDEIDGAIERHLVIVDNGRSGLRNSPLREALYCIRCGACLNACPVFREIGGHAYVGSDGAIAPYPGPIGSIISPGLLGSEQFGHLAQASSLCGACNDACPVDIDLPKLLTRVRAGHSPRTSSAVKSNERTEDSAGVGLSLMSRIGLRAYGAIGSSPRLFILAQRLGAIGTRIISPNSEWMRFPAFTGWGYSKDFPRPASRPFRDRFHQRQIESTSIPAGKEQSKATEVAAENKADLVERFSQELETLGGHANRVTPEELTGQLVAFLRERDIDAVLAWDNVQRLDETLVTQAGISLIRTIDPTLKAGLTGAASAIAETGTLVIPSGKARPLSASLLPDIHIAIIQSSQIVRSLEEALRRPEVMEASTTTLVTGPSRTADIEMTLTIGAHGPKQLWVYIVE